MKAIGNKIIIVVDKPQEKTKAGLFMPEDVNTDYKIGTVITTGPGEKDNPMQVSEGDRIIVQKRAGTEVVIDEKPYTVVSQLDILAIL